MSSHARDTDAPAPAMRDQSHPYNTATQNNRFSITDTPVEMERGGYQRAAHHKLSTIPPLPVVPQSLEHPVELPTHRTIRIPEHYTDDKPDPTTFGVHPSLRDSDFDSARAENMYLEAGSQPLPNPSPVILKGNVEGEGNRRNTIIEPDLNPLNPHSPTLLKGRRQTEGFHPSGATAPSAGQINHVPGQISHPNQQLKGGVWKNGLLNCGDIGICCTGLFCPCMLYGKTQYRLNQKSEKKDPTNMLGYESCNGSCAVFALLLCGCSWILGTVQHTRTRKMYGIPGDVGSDCVRSFCCTCCVLSQDEKEMKYREDHARRHAGPSTGAEYVSPTGMSFSAPPQR